MSRNRPLEETDSSSHGGSLNDLANHLDEVLEDLNQNPDAYLVLHDHDDKPIGVMLSYKAYERLRRNAERDDDIGLPAMLPTTKKHEEPEVAGKLSLGDIQKILDAASLTVGKEQKKKKPKTKKA